MNKVVDAAQDAFNLWRKTPLRDRIQILEKFVKILEQKKDEIAKELASMIKRPLKQNYNEVRGFEERARYMISLAEEALKDVQVSEKKGFMRKICKEPVGVVFIIGAWNYPYLTTVNSLIPALLAGNCVIMKHSPQTFNCADQYAKALKLAGLPDGIFTAVRIDHNQASEIIKDKRIKHVQFTGSERGGKEISALVASHNFTTSLGLELGGNDAAYVRSDADLDFSVENIVDGAFYNSGQSCCGIQRVYVDSSLYNDFVKKAIEETIKYKLGDPFDENSSLGPMISSEAADSVREAINDAVSKGAKCAIDESIFPASKPGTAYVSPQILLSVNDTMKIVTDEVFGPVMAIIPVSSDDEAVKEINKSRFGLTASIWTKDTSTLDNLATDLEVGTVFMNRCDYLDPALAWIGIKNSGKGAALSEFGFDSFIRLQSRHYRL